MGSVVGDGTREVQSKERIRSLCVPRDEDRAAMMRHVEVHFRGAGGDFIYSLKISAHLQEHVWDPVLICSQTLSNIFVTPDISCEARFMAAGGEKCA